jgi:hypothetical protein
LSRCGATLVTLDPSGPRPVTFALSDWIDTRVRHWLDDGRGATIEVSFLGQVRSNTRYLRKVHVYPNGRWAYYAVDALGRTLVVGRLR